MSGEQSNLLTMGDLPDHSEMTQRGKTANVTHGASDADIRRGYTKLGFAPISPYDPYLAGGENTEGDQYAHGNIGACGRPNGFQR